MAFSFEADLGTTFLYNKGLTGNVTIIQGSNQVTVPAADLVAFVGEVGTGPARKLRARAAGETEADTPPG